MAHEEQNLEKESMSYEEKNITVSLVSQSLIAGYYVINWFQIYQAGELTANRLFALWAIVIAANITVTIIASILTNILLTIVEAIQSRKYEEPQFIADERDELIGLKGVRLSYFVFSIGVLISMLVFAFGHPPLIMVSLIIFFGVMAQIAGDLLRIYLYRRGS
jgi:drug/metabolite transporter (DMT)-like permease